MSSLDDIMNGVELELFSEDEIWIEKDDTEIQVQKKDEENKQINSFNNDLFDNEEFWVKIEKKLNNELKKWWDWKRKVAILIDWTNFLFRFYYWIDPFFDVTRFWQENINWVYWMLKKIFWHMQQKVDYLYVCWEWWNSFRKKIFPQYKANRVEKPNNIKFQATILNRLLKKLNIPSLYYEWYEWDDVIWTLTNTIYEKENWNVDIYINSTDKDFCQLLREWVYLFKPQRKQIYTIEDFKKEYEIDHKYFIDYLSIIWDKSDNIEWLVWVWKKWAIKLINRYWTIENLYKNAKDAINEWLIPKKTLQTFLTKECLQKLLFNKKLITLSNIENIECKYIYEYWITYENIKKSILEDLWLESFEYQINDIFTY